MHWWPWHIDIKDVLIKFWFVDKKRRAAFQRTCCCHEVIRTKCLAFLDPFFRNLNTWNLDEHPSFHPILNSNFQISRLFENPISSNIIQLSKFCNSTLTFMNVTVLRHPRLKKRRIFGRASTTRRLAMVHHVVAAIATGIGLLTDARRWGAGA